METRTITDEPTTTGRLPARNPKSQTLPTPMPHLYAPQQTFQVLPHFAAGIAHDIDADKLRSIILNNMHRLGDPKYDIDIKEIF